MSGVSNELEASVRSLAANRCGYCLVSQKLVSYKLEIEHLIPKAKGGETEEENLWLACRQCNLIKGIKIQGLDTLTFEHADLFNPRKQIWSDHFVWSNDNIEVIGKTPCGRAKVSALQLNSDLQKTARSLWSLTGIFPPNQ